MKSSDLASDRLIFKEKKGAFVVLFMALVAQGLVVFFLINQVLIYVLFFHLLSALFFSWSLWKLLPGRLQNDWRITVLLSLLCLLIPLVSGVGLLLSLSLNCYFSKSFSAEISSTVQLPELPDQLLQTMQLSSYKGGSLLGVLEASSLDNQRIKAVLKTRQMEDKKAVPILKRALLDPVDEVRLLAYSMLDKKEKKIDRLINAQLQALENRPSKKHMTEHMNLAEAYWELSYLGLVQGQAQMHVLQDAYSHIKKVIKYRMTDAEAYFLQARIALALNLYEIAESSLDSALMFELNSAKAKSYQKELAFITRHFERRDDNIFTNYQTNNIEELVSGETESWG